jgi:hypothetical protein
MGICAGRFSRAVGAVLLASASGFMIWAQPTSQTPQPAGGESSNGQPSGLPNAPAPESSPIQAGKAAQQPASSSSSSAPVAPRRYWKSDDPNAQVTVLENTLLRVMTNAPLSTGKAWVGEPLLFTLDEDVVVDDVLIIPRGATIHGVVVATKKAGKLTGSPDLVLKLVSLELGGRSYPVYSYEFEVEGLSKTRPTKEKIISGTVIGTLAGAVLDGSADGASTAAGKLADLGAGAAVGAGVGTAVAAVTPGPAIDIPAESQIDFYLASPISVVPASEREAERLSEGLYSGGPVLYVRGETP